MGLNNIKENDYVNVIIQALAHITPLRNHFLLDNSENGSELGMRMGTSWDASSPLTTSDGSETFWNSHSQNMEHESFQRTSQSARVITGESMA